jgi:hypothetical protein
VKEFSKKSAYAQADLHAKFMGMQCPERGNLREFLEGLRMKEDLAQAGVVVDEKPFLHYYFSLFHCPIEFHIESVGSHSVFIIKEYNP